MNLASYDSRYILDRKSALMSAIGTRNADIDRYERMYSLDVYTTSQSAGEMRVSLPTAFDLVEKSRALLITRPPIFKVPPGSANIDAQDRAQKIERYIDGAAYQMNLHAVLNDAAFWAVCAGFGTIRVVYDPMADDEEFPLSLQAPDPRACYWTLSANKSRFTEFVHSWMRSRREIEAEWGVSFKPNAELEPALLSAHYDAKVAYTEYWCEVSEFEKYVPEPKSEMPLLADLVDQAFQATQTAPAGLSPAEVSGAVNGGEDYQPGETQAPESPKQERRRVRKIVHCVVVEDPMARRADQYGCVVVKKPVIVPGYNQIPFVILPGIETPLPGRRTFLSLLFPLSNGDSGDKSIGVLQGLNIATTLDLETAINSPSSPIFTESDRSIDMAPNAVNRIEPGAKVFRVPPDGTNPAVGRLVEMFSQQVARVGIPDVFSGQMQYLSGQAISGFATVFQMLIGHRQASWERSLSSLMEIVLRLTKQYAAGRGEWEVWGVSSATGKPVAASITAEEIGDNYRVQAKLSASMPKDSAALVSLISMLQQKGQLSMESFLDMLQALPDFGLAAESPSDEMQRILRDGVLKSAEFQKFMSSALGAQFLPFMLGNEDVSPQQIQQALNLLFPQQPPTPSGGPGGPPGMSPGGPPGMGQMPAPGIAMNLPPRGPVGPPPGAMPTPPSAPSPIQTSGTPQIALPGGGGVPSAPSPFMPSPEGP